MALDLTKTVDDVLEAAKTAPLEELQAALTSEQAAADPRSTLVTGLQKLIDAAQPEEVNVAENPALKGLKSVTVQVNPEKNLLGAAYYDELQKVTIRSEPVSVKRTKFIQLKLANEELREA